MAGPHDNGESFGEVGDKRRLIYPPVMNVAVNLDYWKTNTVVVVTDAMPDADGNVVVASTDGIERKVFHGCLGTALTDAPAELEDVLPEVLRKRREAAAKRAAKKKKTNKETKK